MLFSAAKVRQFIENCYPIFVINPTSINNHILVFLVEKFLFFRCTLDLMYIIFYILLGVPVRFASPSRFPLIVRSRLPWGSWSRAVASAGRSAAPCAPTASAFAGYPLQSLTQNKIVIGNFAPPKNGKVKTPVKG